MAGGQEGSRGTVPWACSILHQVPSSLASVLPLGIRLPSPQSGVESWMQEVRVESIWSKQDADTEPREVN